MKNAFFFVTLALSACAHRHAAPTPATNAPAAAQTPKPYASTVLQARSASHVAGTIEFTQIGNDEIRVTGKITGLAPNGRFGFHVHENGDCSAKDAASAGNHFNPTNTPHGAHDATASHLGDLGNVASDAQGVATVSVVKKGIALTQAADTFVGRALILHGKPDDLITQPSGNAGARIGCGVIAKN